MCDSKNLTAVIEPHRKGSKISVFCENHGPLGHRFLVEEANSLAESHLFATITQKF